MALTLSGCIPGEPTGRWTVFGSAITENDTGSGPPVLIVGDSLIAFADDLRGPQSLADLTRFVTGRSTTVATGTGVSYAHVVTPSLMVGQPMGTLDFLLNRYQPKVKSKPTITVLALGTNDARLLNDERDEPRGFTLEDATGAAASAQASAFANNTKCVVGVTVTERSQAGAAFVANAKQINGIIRAVGNERRGWVADWASKSRYQDGWYDATDPQHTHLSKEGARQYFALMYNTVLAAVKSGDCN